MAPLKTIVGTCKAYGNVLAIWHQAAHKYWPEVASSAILCTDADPELPAFTNDRVFVNPNGWCERLVACLETYDDDYVVFVLDDYILEAPVSHETVEALRLRMQDDDSLGVIYLTDVRLRSVSPDRNGLFEITRGPYSINSCPGLWRRTFLIETLKAFQDPWAWEAFAFGSAAAKCLRAACWGPSLYTYSFKTGGLIYRGAISRAAYERIHPTEVLGVELSSLQGFEFEKEGVAAKRSLGWKLRFLRAGMSVSLRTVVEFVVFSLGAKLNKDKRILRKGAS